MKKRILALALCLVMMVSLLPVTAYGENPDLGVYITGTGFEMSDGSNYVLKDSQLKVYFRGDELDDSEISGASQGLYQDAATSIPVTNGLVDGETYYFKYQIINHFDPEGLAELYVYLNASNCSLVIPGFTASFVGCRDLREETMGVSHMNIIFQVTKIHEHRWQFGQTGNSLTATCSAPNCPYGEVGVTLTAHSVTLPESPFNAKWETTGDFKEAFPNAQIYGPYYFYKESGGYTQVYENTFTPKAGEYQAQVYIYGLPGNEVAESGAFSTDDGTEPGGGHIDLWIDYTAVDPAVTAQTGDNRPIEIMMISAAVFSVLAAAAFLLDSKRRNASL